MKIGGLRLVLQTIPRLVWGNTENMRSQTGLARTSQTHLYHTPHHYSVLTELVVMWTILEIHLLRNAQGLEKVILLYQLWQLPQTHNIPSSLVPYFGI